MPECPFCGEYLMDQDKLSAHIFAEHPEKVSTPDSIVRAMMAAGEEQNLRNLAAVLTESSLRYGIDEADIVLKWWRILVRLRGAIIVEEHREKPNRQNPE